MTPEKKSVALGTVLQTGPGEDDQSSPDISGYHTYHMDVAWPKLPVIHRRVWPPLHGGTCTTRKQLGVCTGSFFKSGRPGTEGPVPVFLRTKTKGASSVWNAPVVLG